MGRGGSRCQGLVALTAVGSALVAAAKGATGEGSRAGLRSSPRPVRVGVPGPHLRESWGNTVREGLGLA